VTKYVVVGGGITGLAACWYLAKAGHRPLLFEKESRVGGVIRTQQVDGFVIEGGPDSFLAAKPAAMELIKDLGLEKDVIGSNDQQRVTFIVKNGRLIPMPDGLMMMVPTNFMAAARSPLFSWGTKLRMALDYFGLPRPNAPERTVAQFVRDHYGQEAVDYLAEPLLAGVYGGDPEELSASAVLENFVNIEKKYGSLTRGLLEARKNQPAGSTPLFRALRGGMEQLTQALLVQLGDKIDRQTGEVTGLRKTNFDAYQIETKRGTLLAAKVVLACPAHAAAQILKPMDKALADSLAGIPYNSSVTAALAFKQEDVEGKISGFGFLVPRKERKRIAACTFVKAKFDHRVPESKALLRCFLGGSALALDDTAIVKEVRAELETLLGIKMAPLFYRVSRWQNAMAQYTLGHKDKISSIRERLGEHPGVYLAGNAFEGIGIPDCIRTARSAAEAATATA
jgi:oxygen-dependent protoporphyrinogen oxidase